MPKEKYLRLGEILLKEGLIDQGQLEKAISAQRQDCGRLGEVLIKLGIVKEDKLVEALGKQLGIPYFSSGAGMLRAAVDEELKQLVPQDFALKNAVLPLSRTLKSLTVAMSDPLDLILIDNLKKLTGYEINPVIATKSELIKAIEEFYGKSAMLREAVEASYESTSQPVLEEVRSIEEELSLDTLIARAEEAPVIKLVDLIIRQAIDERASDIRQCFRI